MNGTPPCRTFRNDVLILIKQDMSYNNKHLLGKHELNEIKLC